MSDLPRRILELERRLRALEFGPQLGYSSIEDGSIPTYDADGNLISIIGKQPDGSHTVSVVRAPLPLQPTDPQCTTEGPTIYVAWDGNLIGPNGAVDAELPLYATDQACEIHIGDSESYVPEFTTYAGELPRKGGTLAVQALAGVKWVRLQMRAQDGRKGPPSPAVPVTVTGLVDPDEIAQLLVDLADAEARVDEARQRLDELDETTLPQLDQKIDTAKGRLDSAFGLDTVFNVTQALEDSASATLTTAALDAQSKANAAKTAAELAAASYADLVAAGAEQAAIDAAEAYANLKKTEAITAAQAAATAAETAAKAHADTKASAAETAAISAAQTYANQKKAEALTEAAATAQAKADAAKAAAEAAAAEYADLVASGASGDALAAAKTYADTKKAEAITAAESAATAAKNAAISAAATDATNKAAAAETAAKNAAALDATAKANAAKTAAETAAATYADLVAAGAEQAAIDAAAADATSKANAAKTAAETAAAAYADAKKTEAINAAATTAQIKADAAKAAAEAAAATYADNKVAPVSTKLNTAFPSAAFNVATSIDTAKTSAISTAASDATTKANTAKSEAITAAASDAQTKANAAKAAAEAAAKTYADLVAAGAETAAIDAAAADAAAKAETARLAAISAAAADATSKATAAENAAKAAAAADATSKAATAESNAKAASVGKVSGPAGAKVYRDVLSWHESGQTLDGWIVITTPITFNNYMCTVHILGYNYLTGQSEIDLQVGFYAYNQSGGQVLNYGVTNRGNVRVETFVARDENGKVVIGLRRLVRATGVVGPWSYPKITVAEALIGQSTAPDAWVQGWSATRILDGSLPAYPHRRDVTPVDAVVAAATADDKAVTAQSAAATADGKAVAAQNTANQAVTAAATAQTKADAAMLSADGKNAITYTDVAAPGPGAAPTTAFGSGRRQFDVHRNRNATTGEVYAEWLWTGAAWVPVNFGDAMLRSLDVGKITGGSAAFNDFVANNIVGRVATLIELNASRITSGTIAAARLDVSAIAASMATIIQLDASRITAGTINVARLNVAELAPLLSITANQITGGTISAVVTVSGTIQTAASGARVVINGSGLTHYDANGVIDLQATSSGLQMRGRLDALLANGQGVSVLPEPAAGEYSGGIVEFTPGTTWNLKPAIRQMLPGTGYSFGLVMMSGRPLSTADQANIYLRSAQSSASMSRIDLVGGWILVGGSATQQITIGYDGASDYLTELGHKTVKINNTASTSASLEVDRSIVLLGRANGTGTVTVRNALAVTGSTDLTGLLTIGSGGLSIDGARADGAWTAYTPSWLGTSTNPGTHTRVGRYKIIGKTCFFSIQVTLGTNGIGSGNYMFTLPVNAVTTRDQTVNCMITVAGSGDIGGFGKIEGAAPDRVNRIWLVNQTRAANWFSSFSNNFPASSLPAGSTIIIDGHYEIA